MLFHGNYCITFMLISQLTLSGMHLPAYYNTAYFDATTLISIVAPSESSDTHTASRAGNSGALKYFGYSASDVTNPLGAIKATDIKVAAVITLAKV